MRGARWRRTSRVETVIASIASWLIALLVASGPAGSAVTQVADQTATPAGATRASTINAPTGVVDPPSSPVGAAAGPAMDWLSAVRDCTHYVDRAAAGASDSNPGSAVAPWKTIGKAVAVLGPGQTGCVRGSTYTEGTLRAVRSGTATAPIGLRAIGTVVVVPLAPADAASAPTFVFESGSAAAEMAYWLLDGFVVDKAQRNGTGVQLLGAGGGRVRAIAVRNNVVRNGKAGAGILVRGRVTDVVVEGNEVTGFARWVSGSTVSYHEQPGYGRADAHAIAIEGSGGASPSVERVRVQRNSLHDNGGDGVQCLTDTDGAIGTPQPGDPADIDIVDNRIVNTAGSTPVEENAVDIKSCQRVSVRGSDPPGTTGQPVKWNKFAEFLPTRKSVDANGGGNSSNGDAIVVHYRARSILVENLRIWNSCAGISIGRSGTQVRDVVIRRVLLFGVRANQAPPGGTTADAARCRGIGVQATNATRLDLYHLAFDGVPGTAVRLSSYDGDVTDFDLWNSIVVLRVQAGVTSRWVELSAGLTSDSIDSDYNLFWHPDGNPAGAHFVLDGAPVDLAGWRAAGRDRDRPDPLGSHRSDPLFVVDPSSNDYYTRPGSLARDGALDNVGAPRCGVRPDIGFLESCT